MKKHSQQLNIKTMQLANLMAVFHSKKRRKPAMEDSHLLVMDVDREEQPPEPKTQVGNFEATHEGSASRLDGSETDDDSGSGSNGVGEGLLIDSDSEDEFESDNRNVGGHRDGVENGQGLLDFELRAAKAGVFSTENDVLMRN